VVRFRLPSLKPSKLRRTADQSFPRTARPLRPAFARAATWAHRIIPLARPPARTFESTPAAFQQQPQIDDNVPPLASSPPACPRRRLPTLGRMPSIPRFSFPSRKTPSDPSSQSPSSPAAKSSPSSHQRTHSSPQATRWPLIDDCTPSTSTSHAGNPFFRPPPSSPSSRFNSYPISHFSDASTSPTTARYSISSSRTALSSALPSPPIPLIPTPFEPEESFGYAGPSTRFTSGVEQVEHGAESDLLNPKRGGVLLEGLPPSFLDLNNPPSPALSIDSFFAGPPSHLSIAPSDSLSTLEIKPRPVQPRQTASPQDSVFEDDSDDEGDDVLSTTFTFPPPGMVSRFSDWTPSPPASSFEIEDYEGSEGEEEEEDDLDAFTTAKSFTSLSLSLGTPFRASSVDVLRPSHRLNAPSRPYLPHSPSMPLLPTVPKRPTLVAFSSTLGESRSVSRATYPPTGLRGFELPERKSSFEAHSTTTVATA
jgi:hypothetical protein